MASCSPELLFRSLTDNWGLQVQCLPELSVSQISNQYKGPTSGFVKRRCSVFCWFWVERFAWLVGPNRLRIALKPVTLARDGFGGKRVGTIGFGVARGLQHM